jgi:Fe-Mn family superoxide dismutase
MSAASNVRCVLLFADVRRTLYAPIQPVSYPKLRLQPTMGKGTDTQQSSASDKVQSAFASAKQAVKGAAEKVKGTVSGGKEVPMEQPPAGVFSIPPLPYSYSALSSKGISKEQIHFHYDKHHQGYVKKLNDACEAKPELAKFSVEELMMQEKGPIFNLAAQIWNHNFYWMCLSPNGGGLPQGALLREIEMNFGSFDKFKEEFNNAAVGHFGSGWAWLVRDGVSNKLKIVATHDAGNPLTESFHPVLTCDVWEHAFYIDYRNDKAAYMKAFWNCVNWDFVASNI